MKILEMIAFSIVVMAFSVGLLIFLMGGLKYPDESKRKSAPDN